MARRMKSLNDLQSQWSNIRDGINQRYGSYDRQFGDYNTPKSGIGAQKYARAQNAYKSAMGNIQSKLRTMGLAQKQAVGYSYDMIKKVSTSSRGLSNG